MYVVLVLSVVTIRKCMIRLQLQTQPPFKTLTGKVSYSPLLFFNPPFTIVINHRTDTRWYKKNPKYIHGDSTEIFSTTYAVLKLEVCVKSWTKTFHKNLVMLTGRQAEAEAEANAKHFKIQILQSSTHLKRFQRQSYWEHVLR